MLTRMDGQTSRRAFLGLAAAGVIGPVAACSTVVRTARSAGPAAVKPQASTAKAWRNPVPENALPGTSDWLIRNLGADHEIEGYAGRVSVLAGEPVPLFVSTTSRWFSATAYRLGWYQGHGARELWKSKPVRGGAQRAATVSDATSTVSADWDPALQVPTDDWPAGAYLIKLDADSGAQRYVPVTVRSPSCAGKVVLTACVQTWQAYNTWGGYDLYKGPTGEYAERSLVVSLDRPYDDNGANMFLTYERNVVKLAEFLTTKPGGLDLAYVTSMDIHQDAGLLDGASALVSLGHDEYWTPQERAHVTAARNKGVNLAFLGANAMFRRTRLQTSDLGAAREVVCYKSDYTQDPEYLKDPTEVTSDWRDPPNSDPESSLIGTTYEGYPVDAAFVVSSPDSWVYRGTGVSAGASFPHLVGVEYDRVDPAFPVERPIEVLSHSPLTCGGVASYGDSAYYTHAGGAGVYNSGTMRWVEAVYGDQPHGIGGATPAFVRQVTANVLRAFADGPATDKYRARDLKLLVAHAGTAEIPLRATTRSRGQDGLEGSVQVFRQEGQQGLALGRGRARRVAEHAVGAELADAAGPQPGHDLGQRPGLAPLGGVEADVARREREHDRRLHAARVRVRYQRQAGGGEQGGADPGVPDLAVASLGAQCRAGFADRGHVAAVPVDQEHRRPVERRVTAELDQQSRQSDMSDGQCAGEVRVLAARPEGDRRREPDAAAPGARPGRDGGRDPRVGIERQVRPVLLQRTDRHHEHPPRPRGDVRPAGGGESEPGHPPMLGQGPARPGGRHPGCPGGATAFPPGYSGRWQTASMLLPSGSRTKAP